MAVEVERFDVELLRSEIQRTYAAVSRRAGSRLHVPDRPRLGGGSRLPRRAARARPGDVVRVVRRRCQPVCARAGLHAGEDVLDVGCGAGMDTLIAAQMVGPTGSVTGIDMTPEMTAKARQSRRRDGPRHRRRSSRAAPSSCRSRTRSFDVVISNGVIDLIPDKDAVFSEIVPRAATRRSHPTCRRHHPAPGRRGREAQHRPVGRLNCRGSAGSRVRESPAAPRIHPTSRPAT